MLVFREGTIRHSKSIALSPHGAFSALGDRFVVAGPDGAVRCYHTKDCSPEWISVHFGENKAALFSPAGELLSDNAAELEDELIYLVERDDGSLEILKPSEFAARVEKAAVAPTRVKTPVSADEAVRPQ